MFTHAYQRDGLPSIPKCLNHALCDTLFVIGQNYHPSWGKPLPVMSFQ
jgi:hypothetical protein